MSEARFTVPGKPVPAVRMNGTFRHPNGYTEPVRIRRASRDYECDNCGARIAQGTMHGVAYVAFPWHFCESCVEVDDA